MARSSRVSREIDVKQGLVNPSNRSLVKIRRKGEQSGSSGRCGGLLSTTTNHVDLNRISFIPVRHRESQVCRAGLATMFAIEKPISLISVHFIPLPRCPIYLTALFSPGVHSTTRCTVSLSLFRFSNQVGLLCLVQVVNSNEISTRKYCNDTDGCRILTKRN